MGKIVNALVIALIILTGIYTAQFCIGYLKNRSEIKGNSEIVQKTEIEDTFLDGYTISYNLNGGTVTGNPEEYNLFTETFSIIAPTKEKYQFLGWTGSNGDTPKVNITICKGSSGDLTFTANFALVLEAPKLRIENNIASWNTVENASGYKVNINGIDMTETLTTTSVPLYSYKNKCIEGLNVVKVKAVASDDDLNLVDGPYSNSGEYITTKLDTPVVSQQGKFVISWNSVKDATQYLLMIGTHLILTESTSIDVLNYQNYLTGDNTNIRVVAVAEETSNIMNSNVSETFVYIRPKLESINLTRNISHVSWNYDNQVENYKVYLNGILVLESPIITEINLINYSSDFITGRNSIRVVASANGYVDINSTIYFDYVKPLDMEDLTLNVSMSRNVGFWTLGAGGSGYRISRKDLTYSIITINNQHSAEENQQMFMNGLYESNIITAELNQHTIPEIAVLLDGAHQTGDTVRDVDVSSIFKFKTNNDILPEYVPNNLKIRCHYAEMYEDPILENGSTITLTNDNYSFQPIYRFYESNNLGGNHTHYLRMLWTLIDNDGNGWQVYYIYNMTTNTNESILTFSPQNGQRQDLSITSDWDRFRQAEFHLNDDYVLRFDVTFDYFCDFMYSLHEARVVYGNAHNKQSYESFNLESYLDVSDIIKIYTKNGLNMDDFACILQVHFISSVF